MGSVDSGKGVGGWGVGWLVGLGVGGGDDELVVNKRNKVRRDGGEFDTFQLELRKEKNIKAGDCQSLAFSCATGEK